jgi:hypothetical protein
VLKCQINQIPGSRIVLGTHKKERATQLKLFHISNTNEIEVIDQASYRDESAGGFGEVTMQELIVDHPELIPSDDINPSDPPRFLVVRSEAGVTAGSMDILLVDDKGIPTVVETKLIDNREIRRSVLAQGVEYLAHLKTEWTAQRMVDEGRVFWNERKGDLDTQAVQRLGRQLDADFLARIDSNIGSNRMRLIIASDEIPPELKQIIEFLNDASDFDIYGIEVRLFTGKDTNRKILAPRLVGLTETARERKGSTSGPRWSHERFIEDLQHDSPSGAAAFAEELMQFGKQLTGRDVEWGTGKGRGSFTVRLVVGANRFSLFSVYTTAELSVNIGWAYLKYPDLGIDVSEKYRARFKKELGIDFERSSWERGWPMTELMSLKQHKEAFGGILSDFIAEVKSAVEVSSQVAK